jgi:carbonic anhydrase
MNAQQALQQLKEGNKRYIAAAENECFSAKIRKHQAVLEQQPFAIILGCSDSRVPAEIVFDQGLGDLFVIRVAGNIVAPSQIGSVEFACQQFGTELVVVLGHSRCGAIKATVETLLGDADQMSANLAAIVDRVTPAVWPIVSKHDESNIDELMSKATQANVEQSVNMLQMRSRILRNLVKEKKLTIVGAECSIETGEVDFFE